MREMIGASDPPFDVGLEVAVKEEPDLAVKEEPDFWSGNDINHMIGTTATKQRSRSPRRRSQPVPGLPVPPCPSESSVLKNPFVKEEPI